MLFPMTNKLLSGACRLRSRRAGRFASRVDHAAVQSRRQAFMNSRIFEPFFGAEIGIVFGTVSSVELEP
jgi:hypothetical protein